MTDPTTTPPAGDPVSEMPTEAQARTSTAALITYSLLGLWLLTKISVFALAFFNVDVPASLMALVGQVVATEQNLLVAACGYWVGSSQGSKSANAALANIVSKGAAQ